MRTAALALIFIFSVLSLLAQPELLSPTKFPHNAPTNSIDFTMDSIDDVLKGSKVYNNLSNLRIRETMEGIPSIVNCMKYIYLTPIDSVPQERGELAFDEKGNMIYCGRYVWDRDAGNWELSEKMESHYDQSGRDTCMAIYQKHIQENKILLLHKRSAKYNELGNQILDKRYSYFANSNSWLESTWEYDYNNEGSLLKANHYILDNEMGQRLQISKLEQRFDDDNNRILKEAYSHDNDMNWIGQEKMEWDYDSTGIKIMEMAYVWDAIGSQWLSSRKSEYINDSSDCVNLEMIYTYDSSTRTWLINRKIDYGYDMLGNIISKVCSEFDSLTGKWIGAYKFDYAYDSIGREIESIQYAWDENLEFWVPLWNKRVNYGSIVFLESYLWNKDINAWVGEWKRETLFNEYGDYYLDAYCEWDSVSSDWYIKAGLRWDRNYDIYDHEIKSIGYNWDKNKRAWIPGGKFEWVYNMEGDLILYMESAWLEDNDDWTLYSKTFYQYRQGYVTGIPEKRTDNISIYPNPAGSFLRIDRIEYYKGVEIRSMTGQLVLSEKGRKNLLDISMLPEGIYIITLQRDDNTLITKKIVKQ